MTDTDPAASGPRRDLHEQNRRAWNLATDAHNSHKRDQAVFLRAGGSTLFPDELDLLGDPRGQRLLHLQCNAGQDSLSLARLGATVTGVDISDTAIAFARELSAASGIPATFHRADIYDWLVEAAGRERFDIVFSSYGVLGWLSDLAGWARGIAGVLAPGGCLVLLEFHPLLMIFGDDWRPAYPYSDPAPLAEPDGIGDYVAASGPALTPSGWLAGEADFRNSHPVWEFCWGLADVVTAVLDAGLTLTTFREYPYSNGCRFKPDMPPLPDNRFGMPPGMPSLPLMFGLVATWRE